MVIGDVSFNSANEEADIDPLPTYASWRAYPVMALEKPGQIFKVTWRSSLGWQRNGKMSILAWKITLQDNVKIFRWKDGCKKQ